MPVPPELGPEPHSGSGPWPTIQVPIDRQTPVTTRLGEILALVSFAAALGGGFVRYEGKAEWSQREVGELKAQIQSLQAKDKDRDKDDKSDALRLQRIEDSLKWIKRRLGAREEP